MPDLRLYDYAASANCYKVRLLLAQLGRPYERIPIDIFDGDTLTDEYGRINPFRSTPVLELVPGGYLIESNAILVYLAGETSLLPAGAAQRSEVVRWLIYEQTDVMPAIGGLRFRLQTGRLSLHHPDAARRKKIGRQVLGILDEHLAGRDFLVGADYSIADIAVYGYVHVAHEAGNELKRWPAVGRWLRRVAEQPRYINDLEPYPPNARAGAGRSMYA
ncbi:MAG: glutathione S-transferase family protein [Actinobacteria bacterium]|nr:glutathione S-transferase family protein [Actinomycetota bacterium]